MDASYILPIDTFRVGMETHATVDDVHGAQVIPLTHGIRQVRRLQGHFPSSVYCLLVRAYYALHAWGKASVIDINFRFLNPMVLQVGPNE